MFKLNCVWSRNISNRLLFFSNNICKQLVVSAVTIFYQIMSFLLIWNSSLERKMSHISFNLVSCIVISTTWNTTNTLPSILKYFGKKVIRALLDVKETVSKLKAAVSTRMSLSKNLIILTLVLGLIIVSYKNVEGRSVSGWRTAIYPNMYNEPQRVSDRRRLELLLGFLRRKIHLKRIKSASAAEGFDGSENLADFTPESDLTNTILYKLR